MKHLVRIEHQDEAMSRITVVDWCLGNTCNYSCSYCPERLHDGSVKWEHKDMITRFCDRLVSHYSSMGNSLWFQFSGGEPTLYSAGERRSDPGTAGFVDLIEQLHTRGCKVGVISNGSRPLRWWKQALDFLDNVILTHHIEFVDLDHFIALIELLSGRVRTHVNVTMHPDRFEHCLANAFCIADQCSNITLTLKPLLINFGSVMYQYDEAQKQILRETRFNIKTTRAVGGPRGLMRRIYSDGSSDTAKASHLIVGDQNRWAGWSCNAGVELLSIDYYGNLYRGVCRQGGRIGHIAGDHLALPRSPVICEKAVCHCATDIMTTRISPTGAFLAQGEHNV
jgi:organic radical activating enzyme